MNPHPTTAKALSLLAILALPASSPACGDGQTTIFALPTLGGPLIRLNAMSAGGLLTGYSDTANAASHAFLYNGSTVLDINPAGSDFSQGVSVNSAGQVAGDMATGFFETHAFLYSSNQVTDLGTLGGSFSLAVGINEAGRVTGNSLLADNFSFAAFVYANGVLTPLGTLGGSSSFANAINQAGHIAGVSAIDFDFGSHAFLYTNGVLLDLGTLGGSYSSAFALNDSGVVVGESDLATSETRAFMYSNGVMSNLGTLGGSYSSAFAVNTAGQVLGVAETATGDTHGFIYSGGAMVDLGTLGGTYSEPLALDNLGRVVGVSELTNASQRAFLWQNGTMVDLNTLLPANSDWVLISAEFINDSGRIAGYGFLNGVERAFVMDLGSGNNTPVAVAGNDQNLECPAVAVLDGSSSSDPDGDLLTFEWSASGLVLGTNATLNMAFGPGTHVVSLTVADPCGKVSQDFVIVSVTDTTAPTVSCPQAVTIPVGANCQAVLPDLTGQVVASDGCTPNSSLTVGQNPLAGSVLGLGVHSVALTVTDGSGNSSSCNASVSVVDATAPAFSGGLEPITLAVAANCQASVPDLTGLVSVADNCTANGSLQITQLPAATSQVGLGQQNVTVTATDASGNSASIVVTLNVVDSTAPVLTSSPTTVTVSAVANCQGTVPDVTSSVVATDNCTSTDQLVITQNPSVGTVLSVGSHTVTVTVADAAGNVTTTNIPLVITDDVAPVVVSVIASPNTLSPPNNQLVPVTVTVNATDNCDSAPTSVITSVTCNDSVAVGDVEITGALTLNLAAKKAASGNARVYTINVTCTDSSGNESTGTVTVTVPKNNGNGGNKGKP